MKRRGAALLVALFALLLAWGVSAVYRLRVARGDLFPAYSSLRADPLGARALHDAAQLLPGREVERWTRPAARIEAGAGDLVFVLGVRRELEDEAWTALERAAISGASVVIAWHAEASRPGDGVAAREMRDAPWAEPKPGSDAAKPDHEAMPGDESANPAGTESRPAKKKDAAKKDETQDDEEPEAKPPARHASAAERRLGFRLSRRELVTRDETPDALRDPEAPGAWPETLPRWRSDLFFLARPGDGWRTLYARGGDPVMMDRARGAGRVTLLADSFVLSNEAVQRDRAAALLANLLGDARRIFFLESQLGVETESGVAVLARRYGLDGALALLLVLAALWFWRRASPLAPLPPEEAELRLSIAPTAGLEALLRRAVPPAGLHAACVEAWRGTASAADRQRLEKAAPAPAAAADPVAAHRAAMRALSKKHLS